MEKATIMALYGEWLPGVVNEISDEATIDDAARIGAQIRIGNKLVSTTLSRRSIVGLDAGDPATMGKLKRGSQMVVRHEDSWVSALLIKLPEDPSAPDAVYSMMTAVGDEVKYEAPTGAVLKVKVLAIA